MRLPLCRVVSSLTSFADNSEISRTTTGPLLPLADDSLSTPGASSSDVPPAAADLDATLPDDDQVVEDPGATLPYDSLLSYDAFGAMRKESMRTAVHAQSSSCKIFCAFAINEIGPTTEFHLYAESLKEADATCREMLCELLDEFHTLLPVTNAVISFTWLRMMCFE